MKIFLAIFWGKKSFFGDLKFAFFFANDIFSAEFLFRHTPSGQTIKNLLTQHLIPETAIFE